MPTIQKRGDTYRIRVSAGYDSSGKQIMKSTTWKPAPGMTPKQIQKELDRQAVLFEEKVKSGRCMDGNIRFQDFAERWFEDYGKEHLRERTYLRYVDLSERTYQAIGHIRLDKLQPHHLLDFYKQLGEPGVNQRIGGGLSPKTIKHYHTFISSVMERAVKWGIVSENPCRRVDAPKADRKQVAYMDDEQARAFLVALADEPLDYQAIFTTLLLTGMRRGELLGLEWPDVDFDKGVIHIRRTSQYGGKEKGVFTDTTKTEQSMRSISVPAELLDLLRQYRAWQNERRLLLGDAWDDEWTKHPRLFTSSIGAPMHPDLPYNMLHKMLKRHGMPPVSLHSLRHTNATVMIGKGADVRTVSGRLGHSQTSTTLNIYAEFLQSSDRAASEGVADALIRRKTEA